MNSFQFSLLFFPAIIIYIITFVISFYVTRSLIKSLLAAFVKAGIFIFYFGVIFDGTYTFLDDWSYFDGGYSLSLMDLGILNFPYIFEAARSIAGGEHFSYYIYNAYAINFFGRYYFSPVACNIILTVFISYFGVNLAVKEFKITKRKMELFYFFLLLHPDILAWSSVMNGKDIFVLLCHVALLLSVSMMQRRYIKKGLIVASLCSVILIYTRFYVVFMFAVVFAAASIVTKKNYLVKFFSFAILWIVISRIIGVNTLSLSYDAVNQYFVEPFYGVVRIILTPIPFKTEAAYKFLDIPALFHWMLMPFFIAGGVSVYREKTAFSYFFLIYLFSFLILYGLFEELQGPRHRVQLDYAFAVLQFFGFYSFLTTSKRKENFPSNNYPASYRTA